MTRLDLPAVTQWITAAALDRPDNLAGLVAERCGVTRATAQRALRRLVDSHWLVSEGQGRTLRHRPGLLRQVVRHYPIDGLAEDEAWSRDFADRFALPVPVHRMAQHLFGELVNNAIEHSHGTRVCVSMRQTPAHLHLLVSDDGLGAFASIATQFGVVDPVHAMLDLAKGKLTTRPDRHCGRGLFFTARMADVLELHANDAGFQSQARLGHGFSARKPMAQAGTSVFAGIALDTTRSVESVIADWSCDGRSADFDRTSVPLRLLTSATVGLDSRAQARRVAARLDRFKRADIDFDGIDHVGHGFADELFRVLARPGLQMVPVRMTGAVAAVIESVVRG